MAIVTSDVDVVSGYMARPMDEGQHPGIVVIQEWWGLDEHIKDVTRRFANEGYVALAPDLFHGQVTDDPQQAMKLVGGLDRGPSALHETPAELDVGQPSPLQESGRDCGRGRISQHRRDPGVVRSQHCPRLVEKPGDDMRLEIGVDGSR